MEKERKEKAHTTTFFDPVVTESATWKRCPLMKAFSSRLSASTPSALSGKYATRVVPRYLLPGAYDSL